MSVREKDKIEFENRVRVCVRIGVKIKKNFQHQHLMRPIETLLKRLSVDRHDGSNPKNRDENVRFLSEKFSSQPGNKPF